jgi:hypothetical protein
MMKLSAPIHQLKRKAKLAARKANTPLHAALDAVAGQEGFVNWSLRPPRILRRRGFMPIFALATCYWSVRVPARARRY